MYDEHYKRFWELYDLAVSRYLDKTDFDVDEWLSDEESQEYNILKDEMYGCGDMVFERYVESEEI